MATVEDVKSCLAQVIDPNTGKDFVSSKTVRDVRVVGGEVLLRIELGYPAKTQHTALTALISDAVGALPGVTKVEVDLSSKIVAHAVQRGLKPLRSIKNIIAVASGKGGVGKSTTAINLALALTAEGARVGILDADIYGPSLPLMLGIDIAKTGRPQSADGQTIEPMHAHGLQASSIGFMIDQDQPMVWRGPMATQALQQLLEQTNWAELDYLIVDMPPGTGDIQLSLSQKVPLTGAVIVTTPQDIALLDARKGLRMFEKVGVPILGVVENMAVHVCSQCGHAEHIFGADGGKQMAQQYNVDYLGALPLDIAIREQTDSGKPTVVAAPDSAIAKTYCAIARKVAIHVAEKAKDMSLKFPTIVVQNT
ncbi:MAG: iron-sulfur cluster carrier protein ApbC [Burkholderiaceae bacterium]|nr:MAG: iron-sulfur cluster carrier protein ApbC [Burkholderiaceae bacterium]